MAAHDLPLNDEAWRLVTEGDIAMLDHAMNAGSEREDFSDWYIDDDIDDDG